jgi:hypothetical protein
LHRHVLAQCAVVVEVFPAQRQAVHALAQHVAHAVLDLSSGLRGSAMQRAAASSSPSLRSTAPSSITPPSLVMLPPSKRPSTTRRPRRPNSMVPTSISSVHFGFGIARSLIKIRHLDKRAFKGQCRPRFYGVA